LGEVLPAVTALVPAHRRRVRVTRTAAACRVARDRTRQVLGNLVENALRHGPPTGRIDLRADRHPGGLSILVADEGSAVLGLMEALRRPDPGTGMSGLGLWIVRQLVTADGGRLRLHHSSRGVALEVLLPALDPPD
jgi:signal transduction histidine kinase